jgi:hypothetical protein
VPFAVHGPMLDPSEASAQGQRRHPRRSDERLKLNTS